MPSTMLYPGAAADQPRKRTRDAIAQVAALAR